MITRYKKVNVEKTLWTSAILTILLSSLLATWLFIESFDEFNNAKKRNDQFSAIYKIIDAFNAIGRERGFTNELVLASMENKTIAWDALKKHQALVNQKLDAIDVNVFNLEDWVKVRTHLRQSRALVDSYKNKLAVEPEETKLAIYGMIDATETFRQIMASASLRLVKEDNAASSSLLQLLTLSNIRDNTGRIAAPFLIALHFNAPLSISDIEDTARRLERLQHSWEILAIIPDDIPSEENHKFERLLETAKAEFSNKSLSLVYDLNTQSNNFKSYSMDAYEFSQRYRQGLEYVVSAQSYYSDELTHFHVSSEGYAAMKVIVVLSTIIFIITLIISINWYIQKRLLKPLFAMNRIVGDIAQGKDTDKTNKLKEMGELQDLFNSFDKLDYQMKKQQHKTNELEKESREDPLTQLSNRRYFQIFSEELLSNASHNFPISLVILDLDFFKNINDTWGHPFGDKVLITVAKIIQKYTPEDGLATRLGGEEFSLLLPFSSSDIKMTELLHNLQTDINACELYTENGVRVDITASFGVSETTHNDLSSLLSNADQALYKAKKSGRNCIRYHIE